MKRVHTSDPDVIEIACRALSEGNVIIYPTETSYGLGVDATNPEALKKLLSYKGNRLNKAISIAVSDQDMAEKYIEMNPTAATIFVTMLPGPVTVVAKSKGMVVPLVESERHTLGIRYSSLPLVTDLVRAYGKPITATSANTSGMKQIFSYDEWKRYVPKSRQELISVFIDAGRLPVRPPSTVVDTTLNNPEVLRQGELIITEGATHFESHSPAETIALGKKLVEQQIDLLTTQPIVIALQGELGAGKTHFVKGVAEALGITDTVNSPTYTIMHEYNYQTKKISGTLYHIDTWRLFEEEDIKDLGIEQRIMAGSVIAIEWQQKAHTWIESLKKPLLIAWVSIEVIDEPQRKFSIVYEHVS